MGKHCSGSKSSNSVSINDYLDKQLDLKPKGLVYIDSELERHLEECPVCRLELQEQQQLFDALSGLEQLEPPEDFTARLLAKLPQPIQQVSNQQVSNQQLIKLKWGVPTWVLLLTSLVLTAATACSVTSLYWLNMFINFRFISTVTDTLIIKVLDLSKNLLGGLWGMENIVLALIRAIWAFVTAFPLPFAAVAGIIMLSILLLVKLINSYQQENYA